MTQGKARKKDLIASPELFFIYHIFQKLWPSDSENLYCASIKQASDSRR
ncbi:MAG: hypothetical protein GQF41_2685 [Candidatus Rifleibacterium amylolyticum]|nr:MAG: hypothetical protein GQF41_2685 [Candidatus Rifleibacterium amylolyticum]